MRSVKFDAIIYTMYKPPQNLLQMYARVLIDFALNSGKGVKPKEIVYVQFKYDALPLALQVQQRLLEKKCYPMMQPIEEDLSQNFYKYAQNHQLDFFPDKYSRGLVDQIDHRVYLIADRDPMLLKNVAPEKIIRKSKSAKPLREWLDAKEDAGKLTWTLCLYGTPGLANEAGLSHKSYWEQITKACYLDLKDPLRKWRSIYGKMDEILSELNKMPIENVHLKAKNTDLWIKVGEKRKWVGGSGRNIPSFEIFTSPDWRGTEGHIRFDLPLYRYGNLVKDVYLEFKEGKVVKATAGKNEKLLREMIKTEGADKVGEFSLTDKKFSRIDKFMATTLFDENFGGDHGNTHIALGKSYHDCYKGDAKKVKKAEWKRLGYNDSVIHTDIIATKDRRVEAVLKGGKKEVIYEGGEFRL